MSDVYDTIIIGAGVAGLAAALRLKKRGQKVLVLEKNAYVGGKMNQYESMGYRWDTGPSLFTMPRLVDELYELYHKKPTDYYQYSEEEEACRYFFSDDTCLHFYTDRAKLKEELSNQLDVDVNAVDAYLDKSAEKYNSIGTVFLEHAIHQPSELPWKKLFFMFPKLLRTNLLGTLHQLNQAKLKNKHLVQIFDRYATYNGSNPYRASGILSMIPHLEQNIGTYFPRKGMRSIVDGLYQLSKEVGVPFELGTRIEDCKKSTDGYVLKTAEKDYKTKRVISAIDCLSFYDKILKDAALTKKYERQERSSSAIIFYWGIQKLFPKLGLHNIFFSDDYQEEFELIFDRKEIPIKGTIYIHISSKINKEDAPNGSENWFVMLNVPAGAPIDEATQEQIKIAILERLELLLKTSIAKHIVTERVWTPKGIELNTGAIAGALYGAASNEKTAALSRHPNFSKKYKGIYFCGGTVHPGGGIPLSIQSAKIVDKLIANEDGGYTK